VDQHQWAFKISLIYLVDSNIQHT